MEEVKMTPRDWDAIWALTGGYLAAKTVTDPTGKHGQGTLPAALHAAINNYMGLRQGLEMRGALVFPSPAAGHPSMEVSLDPRGGWRLSVGSAK